MKNGLPWVRSWISSSSPSREGSSPARSRSSSRVSSSLQRLEGDLPVGGGVAPGGRVLGAEVDDRQRLRALDRVDQLGQHPVAALVDPVQVLDQDDHGLAPVGRVEEAADDPPRARCRASALIWGTGRSGSGTPRKSKMKRQVLGELGVEQERPAGDLLAGEALRLAPADPEVGAQHLQHRHVGDRLAVRLRLGFEDLDPLPRQRSANSRQSRLLPMPGSATTPITAPPPPSARSQRLLEGRPSPRRGRRSARSRARARGRAGSGPRRRRPARTP